MESDRLSQERWERAQQRALLWRERVERQSHGKGCAEVFRLAARGIEEDVEAFCDRAEIAFEEIEAFGQEPQLDTDWLEELTGEKDSFYFSTESLVLEPEMLPSNRGKNRKKKAPDEAVVVKAVEEAVQSFEQAMAVSHSENVDEWVQRIKGALEEHQKGGGGVEFWTLQHTTQLSPSALFLGLLLGHQHWEITQHGFYGQVFVELKKKK